MHANLARAPRWAIAVAACALLLSLIAISGPGRAFAQDSGDATPTPTTTETPATTTADETPVEAAATSDAYAAGDALVVADGPLNLRDAAGTDAEIVSELETGAAVEIVSGPEEADDYSWYEVTTADDETGWVAGEFLGDEIASPDFAAGDEVVVVDGPLNVRDEGALSGAVVTQLDADTSVTILSGPVAADDYTWWEIQVDDQTSGWAAGEFLGLPSAAASSSGSDGQFAIGDGIVVDLDGLSLRSAAGLDSEVVDNLDLGALFLVQDGPVSADGYTWYQVYNFYYGEGWVAGDLMTLNPDGFPYEAGS